MQRSIRPKRISISAYNKTNSRPICRWHPQSKSYSYPYGYLTGASSVKYLDNFLELFPKMTPTTTLVQNRAYRIVGIPAR